jgi:two-component system chemotaxis response regulator CheB
LTVQEQNDPGRNIIVIGGSAGSSAPLKRLLSELPADLPASVFVVQHRAVSSVADSTRGWSSSLPVAMAENGMPVERSRVYVAPVNRHLFLEDGVMRVLTGPRENMVRPSIDVLFRSAAVAHGPRVIGVILSGTMEDGVQGLIAIRRCRGVAVVQDPADALSNELPKHALQASPAHRVAAAGLAELLARLARESVAVAHNVPSDLALEARAAVAAMTDPAGMEGMAEASHLSCPECQGPLWRIPSADDEHYRCEVGHAYGTETLFRDQGKTLERALWVAYRTLIERARLLERLVEHDRSRGNTSIASGYAQRLHEIQEHARAVLRALSATDVPEGIAPEPHDT